MDKCIQHNDSLEELIGDALNALEYLPPSISSKKNDEFYKENKYLFSVFLSSIETTKLLSLGILKAFGQYKHNYNVDPSSENEEHSDVFVDVETNDESDTSVNEGNLHEQIEQLSEVEAEIELVFKSNSSNKCDICEKPFTNKNYLKIMH